MNGIAKVLVFYLFLRCSLKLAASGSSKTWTFDLLNITTTSSNTDMVDLELHIHRLGRGRYGFSGFADIKQSFGDEVNIEFSVKHSLNKDGPYSKVPFGANVTLTTAMNDYYKSLGMPTAKECCVNAPVFEDEFVPPLTPRRIEINECIMSTDNLPDYMQEGYYWVLINIPMGKGEKLSLVWQTYVEANKFI